MERLEELRQTLRRLDAVQLPDHYDMYLAGVMETNIAGNTIIEDAQTLLDQTIQQQYNNAKQRYLRQRFEELFLQHVATYNGKTFQFPVPSFTNVEEESMKQKRQELQDKLRAQVSKMAHKRHEVVSKYNILRERKEELKGLVEDLVSKSKADEDEEGEEDFDVDEDEDDLSESEIKEQRAQLEHLQAKKLALQAKLAVVKVENQHLVTENQRFLNEYNKICGDSPITIPSDYNNVAEILSETTKLEKEIKEGEEKMHELQELVEWYDAMTSALNELSGIRVVNVSSAMTNDGRNNDALIVKLQLLDEYTLQVELQPSSVKKDKITQSFRVAQATLTGDLMIGEGFSQARIPPLDDLVVISQQLPEHEDLRFLIRETLARIRAVGCRVDELDNLRKSYAVTIENEGERIYCSLNEGVTAVLCLSLDFPMLKGSALVEQLIGTGGWDTAELEKIRIKINTGNYKGAVQLMDALAVEIKNTGYQQKTPFLPLREVR